MTSSQRLLARLRQAGLDIPDGAVIQRSYAGIHQRRQGAWRWWVEIRDSSGPRCLNIGSHSTVTELLRASRIVASRERFNNEISIDPVPETEPGSGDVVQGVKFVC